MQSDLEELQEREAKSRELQELLSITREELVQQRQQVGSHTHIHACGHSRTLKHTHTHSISIKNGYKNACT